MKVFYIYLLVSRSRTLYIGVTSNLVKRLAEHRSMRPGSFTSRYRVTRPVYIESTPNARAAIVREKQIKGLSRKRKIGLIEAANPLWEDLSEHWFGARHRDSSLRSE
ncbi:MAG TPA: GIY-YIG nuclease family protein [Gemmatimonadales bacterium]|nr:GIY-YIG nuclease family protein [Gemmatimonadales bacterium]